MFRLEPIAHTHVEDEKPSERCTQTVAGSYDGRAMRTSALMMRVSCTKLGYVQAMRKEFSL